MTTAAKDATKTRRDCRHCKRPGVGNRPRGLCWICHFDLTIRAKYQGPETRYTRRGHGTGKKPAVTLPAAPTTARPGTEEKIRELEERARLGLSLWHPQDATLFPQDVPAFHAECGEEVTTEPEDHEED